MSTILLLNFELELFYRDGPFIKNVSFVENQKNVNFSKLVKHQYPEKESINHIAVFIPNNVILEGIAHQFWMYKKNSSLNKRNIFYKRAISIKQLWLEIIEIGCSSQSDRVLLYISLLYSNTMFACLCVCLRPISSRTAGPIWLNFFC